jgi:hypothetical protein
MCFVGYLQCQKLYLEDSLLVEVESSTCDDRLVQSLRIVPLGASEG